MKELMNLKLFSLFENRNSIVTDLKMAYEEFALKLHEKLQKNSNLTSLYYDLGYLYFEPAIFILTN